MNVTSSQTAGIVICINCCHLEAPSISAASYNSRGIWLIEEIMVIMKSPTPHQLATNPMHISGLEVSQSKENPCLKAGTIGKSNAEEKPIWTKDEFDTFIKGIEDKPQSKEAFDVLF